MYCYLIYNFVLSTRVGLHLQSFSSSPTYFNDSLTWSMTNLQKCYKEKLTSLCSDMNFFIDYISDLVWPVLTWSQKKYLKLLLTVRYFESWGCSPTILRKRNASMKMNECKTKWNAFNKQILVTTAVTQRLTRQVNFNQ